jgi:hypothetical protein
MPNELTKLDECVLQTVLERLKLIGLVIDWTLCYCEISNSRSRGVAVIDVVALLMASLRIRDPWVPIGYLGYRWAPEGAYGASIHCHPFVLTGADGPGVPMATHGCLWYPRMRTHGCVMVSMGTHGHVRVPMGWVPMDIHGYPLVSSVPLGANILI